MLENVDVGLSRWLDRIGKSRILTIDTHTAGEPLRIILGGVPLPDGLSILERRASASRDWDRYRRFLMWEPRGHKDMYGALILPPSTSDADFGVLYMHNDGYSTGCGHATIALAKVAVELGWVKRSDPITTVSIDAASGRLKAFARLRDGEVQSSGFENVPSFVLELDQTVDVPGVGKIRFDLAYGGAFYAFVEAEPLGLELTAQNTDRIRVCGMAIKRTISERFSIVHPMHPELGYLYGTIFTGPARARSAHSRHVCVFADGAIDRSPTGTGVSGRLAILRSRGEIGVGEPYAFESITEQTFVGRALRDITYQGKKSVAPEIEGTAFLTGIHQFVVEEGDGLAGGFYLG